MDAQLATICLLTFIINLIGALAGTILARALFLPAARLVVWIAGVI